MTIDTAHYVAQLIWVLGMIAHTYTTTCYSSVCMYVLYAYGIYVHTVSTFNGIGNMAWALSNVWNVPGYGDDSEAYSMWTL